MGGDSRSHRASSIKLFSVFLLTEDCEVLCTTGMYSGLRDKPAAKSPVSYFSPSISQTHAAFVSVCFTRESLVLWDTKDPSKYIYFELYNQTTIMAFF